VSALLSSLSSQTNVSSHSRISPSGRRSNTNSEPRRPNARCRLALAVRDRGGWTIVTPENAQTGAGIGRMGTGIETGVGIAGGTARTARRGTAILRALSDMNIIGLVHDHLEALEEVLSPLLPSKPSPLLHVATSQEVNMSDTEERLHWKKRSRKGPAGILEGERAKPAAVKGNTRRLFSKRLFLPLPCPTSRLPRRPLSLYFKPSRARDILLGRLRVRLWSQRPAELLASCLQTCRWAVKG
jgi:hypothetical protein